MTPRWRFTSRLGPSCSATTSAGEKSPPVAPKRGKSRLRALEESARWQRTSTHRATRNSSSPGGQGILSNTTPSRGTQKPRSSATASGGIPGLSPVASRRPRDSRCNSTPTSITRLNYPAWPSCTAKIAAAFSPCLEWGRWQVTGLALDVEAGLLYTASLDETWRTQPLPGFHAAAKLSASAATEAEETPTPTLGLSPASTVSQGKWWLHTPQLQSYLRLEAATAPDPSAPHWPWWF